MTKYMEYNDQELIYIVFWCICSGHDLCNYLPLNFVSQTLLTVKIRLSGNTSIGKVALAAYFHRAHYNSPMALAAYFCRYPASRGISRAVPKVSAPSESAPRTPDGQ
jgi:hypothetical protein